MAVLTDKGYRTYDYFSRYARYPYYYNKIDEKYIYGTTSQINKDTPYVLYTVINGDTLDSIALATYNNPTYYYLICDFNQIQDPFVKLKAGEKLKLPIFSNITYSGE